MPKSPHCFPCLIVLLLLIPSVSNAQYDVEIDFIGYSTGDTVFMGEAVEVICRVTDENGDPVDFGLTNSGVDFIYNFQTFTVFPDGFPNVGEKRFQVLNRRPDSDLRRCRFSYPDGNGEDIDVYSPYYSLNFAPPQLILERGSLASPILPANVELDEPVEHFCRLVDPWGNPISGESLDLDRTASEFYPWNWLANATTTDANGRIKFTSDVVPNDVADQIDPNSMNAFGLIASLRCRGEYEREWSDRHFMTSIRDSDLRWIPADSINIDVVHSIPPSIELTDTAEWSCLVRNEAGDPIIGSTITASFAGGVNLSSTTDQNGQANFSWGPSSPDPIGPGFHRPTCRMQDPNWPNFYWNPSHIVAGFIVEPDFDRVLTVTPASQSAAIDEEPSWTCTIKDENGIPLEGKTIRSFGTAISDVNGEASFSIPTNQNNVGRQVGSTTDDRYRCSHTDPVSAPGLSWFSDPPSILWTASPGTVVFDLKVFLDGPYVDGEMTSELTEQYLVPSYQPYNQSPWFFETVQNPGQPFPQTSTVDWIMVSLRTDPLPSSEVARAAVLLRKDGTPYADYPSYYVTFDGLASSPYYVVIEHRNHLPIMSAVPLVFNPDSSCLERYCYDFSQQATYGIGAQRDLGGGVYGMWGGDGNRDKQVTAFDFLNVWLPQNGGSTGYDFGDFDMNGSVTAFDFLRIWLPANGRSVQF